MLAVVTAAILFSVSSSSATFFRYYQMPFRRADTCNVCYGTQECLPLDQSMCEYYMDTSHLLWDDDDATDEQDPEMKQRVDDLLFGIVEKASQEPHPQCLPLISSYSDCNKDNICSGCKTCQCDHLGTWNCTTFHCAADDVNIDVQHRVLVIVMKNLANYKSVNRSKRSTNKHYQPYDNNTKIRRETSEEITSILFNMNSNLYTATTAVNGIEVSTNNPSSAVNHYSAATLKNVATVIPNNDYLDFDQVLNNLSMEPENNIRRKLPLDFNHNDPSVLDYVIDDVNINLQNIFHQGESSVTELPIEKNSTILIDLLESEKLQSIHFKDYLNSSKNIAITDKTDFDSNNLDVIAVNIMKRDTKSVLNDTVNNHENENATFTADEVQNNILTPLNNIINDKRNEMEELVKIRENLINFIKKYHNDDFEIDYEFENIDNKTTTKLAMYKLEIEPPFKFEYNLRTNNLNILNKYMYKLKTDIYQVLKDIIGIQKYSDTKKMPDDLKFLIRAMKKYIKNNGGFKNKENTLGTLHKDERRHLNNNALEANPPSVIEGIVKIIEIIDKDMSLSNALTPLSYKSRKILKRIIKNHYTEEINSPVLRGSDPSYKLSNDLATIGANWQELADNIAKSSVLERSYAVKRLFYQLMVDIEKINDALKITDFSYKRRKAPINGLLECAALERINQGLRSINDKIQIIIKLYQNKKAFERTLRNKKKKTKKESFLNKFKAIFKNSKNDIAKLLKRKVPKAEIVKEIASKNIEDLNTKNIIDYENTLRKWQENLNVRLKRSSNFKRIKNRIRNILPKYLRGKVNPAISAKWNKSKTVRKRIMRSTKKHIAATLPTTRIQVTRKKKSKL